MRKKKTLYRQVFAGEWQLYFLGGLPRSNMVRQIYLLECLHIFNNSNGTNITKEIVAMVLVLVISHPANAN